MRARSFGALTRALADALSVPALFGLPACAASREPAAETPASRADEAAKTPTAAAAGAEPAPAYDQPGAVTPVDQALADLQRAEGELGLAVEALSARKS